MTGRHVPATEALAMGLADKVASADDLLDLAMTDAARFARGPTVAYGAVKQAVRDGYNVTLAEGVAIETEAFAIAFASQDARIGVNAFLDKEKPEFTGQ